MLEDRLADHHRFDRLSKIGVGIIGMGAIGTLQRDLLNDPDESLPFSLAAIADPITTSPSDQGWHRDHQSLLCSSDVEAVIISTPPSTHFSLCRDSLRMGKHVFVDKPPTLTARDCDRLALEAGKRGLCLFYAFHTKYNPAVNTARSALAEEIVGVEVTYRESAHQYHRPESWVFNPLIAGGGVLMDSGINALSAVMELVPAAADYTITEARLTYRRGTAVEVSAEVAFAFAGNRVGRLSLDWMHQGPEVREITLRTHRHVYLLDLVRSSVSRDATMVSSPAADASNQTVNHRAEYRATLLDFAAHIRSGESLTSSRELAFVLDAYSVASRSGDRSAAQAW